MVVGRGMLTLGSLSPALAAEILPLPPLCLKGRAPPNDTIIPLDVSKASEDLTHWPEFHNGVAAALRLHSAHSSQDRGYSLKISRSWIMYNKNSGAGGASHAGVLLGLGLQGYLSCLSLGDIRDYLTPAQEPTMVAILIGVPATRLGSADPLLSRTLCLHLPSLLAPSYWDFDVSPTIQSAALAGLGLLHCGRANRLITEFLLAELCRPPTAEILDTREAGSIVAGWALGMVLLCKGQYTTSEDMKGVADLKVEDRLFRTLEGGRALDQAASFLFPHESSSSPSVIAKSKKVLPCKLINTNLIAPGSIIALALMYMKSSNAGVSSRLMTPTNAFELDKTRPDVFLFRAMGYCLVNWSTVEGNIEEESAGEKDWIQCQIPELVMDALFERKSAKSISTSSFDADAAFPVYICITAGYCFGVGLIFAGTGHRRTKMVLLHNLRLLQSLREKTHPAFSGFSYHSHKATIDMCVSVVALSLAAVMAGSGDIDCLRVFRELRWRHDEGSCGFHMSVAMAIGLLFLGGGRASLRRDPIAIGALVIAFAPRFPHRTADNQYHIQALRHLYVLAVEWRSLVTVDAETGQSISVTLQLTKDGVLTEMMTTPCLLPELSSFDTITVQDKSIADFQCHVSNATIPERFHASTPTNYLKSLRSVPSTLYVQRKKSVAANNLSLTPRNPPLESHSQIFDAIQCYALRIYASIRNSFGLDKSLIGVTNHIGNVPLNFDLCGGEVYLSEYEDSPCSLDFLNTVVDYIADFRTPSAPSSRRQLSTFILMCGLKSPFLILKDVAHQEERRRYILEMIGQGIPGGIMSPSSKIKDLKQAIITFLEVEY